MFAVRTPILPPLKLASRFLSTLPPPPPSPSSTPFRASLIRQLLPPNSTSKPIASASSRSYARHVSGSGGKGPYGYGNGQSQVQTLEAPTAFEQQGGWKKVAVVGGVVAASVVVSNAILNRETRDALAPLEREHLHSTFRYVGLGLAITAASAYQLHRTGFSARIMTANPWVVLGGGVLLSVGSMYACFNTAPENTVQKLFFFTAFQVAQSIAIAPLLFLSPALLARAGLYTVGVVGSLAYVGATARQDKFLYIGGPVLAGIVVVALSSLAPMILPRTAVRTLAITESLALYGGLAVFSAAILMDVQKLLLHARQAAQGLVKLDPVGESIGIELHTLNIFVRMVQMLAMSQNRRK